ncbi:hypothetical protein PIB30_049504 [Stylosanthes scabra]|uniref:Uncharacterized protein n=1 Tax=Stylosanthes scabra TaxID=79078 RepID=A0ABU6TJA6_9FABA|nr:hypothetical protein [Stylosanthes scabra]
MVPLSVQTRPCTARRKDVPSPPELGTRWTWLSAPRRDTVCADRRGTQDVGVRTHPRETTELGVRRGASVPEDELSDKAMTLGRSGTMDHRDADDGVMVVTNSGNIGDEETVYDRSPEADNAAEPEMPTDNTAEARTGRMTGPGVMADNTADAVMTDGTAVVMAGNTETLDTAELGQDETAGVALAYKPDHRRAEMQDIPVQSDPSSDHHT